MRQDVVRILRLGRVSEGSVIQSQTRDDITSVDMSRQRLVRGEERARWKKVVSCAESMIIQLVQRLR